MALLTSVAAIVQGVTVGEVPLKMVSLVDNSRDDRGRKIVSHPVGDMRDQRWIAQ